MNAGRIFVLAFLAAAAATAAPQPDFSGKWVFSPAKSTNVGMMAGLEIHLVVHQERDLLTIHEQSLFRGQPSSRELRYDLRGQPTVNSGPMGDKNQTVAHWEGDRVVATWTSEGAVAGTKVTRQETRSLSTDGKTMTVASVRGTAPPIVMVYERE
jgi:hypothetical protein